MRLWTTTDENWMEELFKDARNLHPECFIAGCLMFGVMITGLLVQLIIHQGCTTIGYKK